ncbi:MAG TPA: HAD hydrolase family protein, partial [Mycobacteriales bacterium]|nr:HAD hydrolase family protein [Mycobacteriales bacterium]
TGVPAQALVALHEAQVTLVLVSGRTREQLVEAAAITGADGFVGELGAVLGWDRARQGEVLRGAMPDDLVGTPYDVACGARLPERLFERYAGRLEWHSPWHVGHLADLMLRGNVDVDEVESWLGEVGFGWLAMHDNGVLPGRSMPGGGEPVHVYHLLPAGIDKGVGVARDLARRGLGRGDAVAIGDSRSDLVMAAHVGHFYLVANGAVAPATLAAASAYDNVTVTDAAYSLGWAEAVRHVLGLP